MIKRGTLTDYIVGFVGYIDGATQEEAERLSGERHTSGLIIFIPFEDGVPLEACLKCCLREDE